MALEEVAGSIPVSRLLKTSANIRKRKGDSGFPPDEQASGSSPPDDPNYMSTDRQTLTAAIAPTFVSGLGNSVATVGATRGVLP